MCRQSAFLWPLNLTSVPYSIMATLCDICAQAGVANELSKLYTVTLGGFAPVALGMFPDAADRPSSAYQDLTPTALPEDAPVDEVRQQDVSGYMWDWGFAWRCTSHGFVGLPAAGSGCKDP